MGDGLDGASASPRRETHGINGRRNEVTCEEFQPLIYVIAFFTVGNSSQ